MKRRNTKQSLLAFVFLYVGTLEDHGILADRFGCQKVNIFQTKGQKGRENAYRNREKIKGDNVLRGKLDGPKHQGNLNLVAPQYLNCQIPNFSPQDQ